MLASPTHDLFFIGLIVSCFYCQLAKHFPVKKLTVLKVASPNVDFLPDVEMFLLVFLCFNIFHKTAGIGYLPQIQLKMYLVH